MSADEDLFRRIMDQMGVRGSQSKKGGESGKGLNRSAPNSQERDEHELFLNHVEEMIGFEDKDLLTPEPTKPSTRRIKAGKGRLRFQWEESLDLHGMTTVEALDQLASFVTRAFAQGQKSIMVITGKGKHSAGGVGVLKREVEQWILQKGKRFIASYAEAPRAHGGRGAYILNLRGD